jgi:hypothetical protein
MWFPVEGKVLLCMLPEQKHDMLQQMDYLLAKGSIE